MASKTAVINASWSHFLISKEIFNRVGPFDEALLEIGGEDDDYLARMAVVNLHPDNFYFDGIRSKLRKNRKMLIVNSYGKNMANEKYGYSNLNYEYMKKKWQVDTLPFEGAVEVKNRFFRYWKLRK